MIGGISAKAMEKIAPAVRRDRIGSHASGQRDAERWKISTAKTGAGIGPGGAASYR